MEQYIPLISVVVPVFNTPEESLRLCIESLRNQTLRATQIILVDDGSTNNSGTICDEYATIDERIVVVHKENGGVSSARNEGLKHVTGRYLAFVDSDDELYIEAWENTVFQMNETGANCAVFGWERNSDCETQKQVVAHSREVIDSDEAMTLIAGDNETCGGGYLWNKIWNLDVVKNNNTGKIPLFNTGLFAYEDKLWILECLNHLGKIVLLPDIYYHYKFSSNSLSNSSDSWYKRQFNAYKAYDTICDYLEPINKEAYRAAIGKYFRFSFIDMRNMYSWRKGNLLWYAETQQAVLKVCKRIKPGDLKGFKYVAAWLACMAFLPRR